MTDAEKTAVALASTMPVSRAGRLDVFAAVYREELRKAVVAFPDEYGFKPAKVDTVADRMIVAFARGSFNKDGRAIKATCKRLGIKYTYAAINSYLRTD
jgi:hypothetical protein